MVFEVAVWPGGRPPKKSKAKGDILDSGLAPPSEVIFTAVGQEAVLLHTGTNMYFGLDPLGTLVFQRLASGVGPLLIIDEIVETFDVDRERATSDLSSLLRDFLDHRLIVPIPVDAPED